MTQETQNYFRGYDLDKALSLLGPANLGDAEPQGFCGHLEILIQNIVCAIFRFINYIFGDHQWYNNNTARYILQEYHSSMNVAANENQLPLNQVLTQKLAALYDALSLRTDGNRSYTDGIQKPAIGHNEHTNESAPTPSHTELPVNNEPPPASLKTVSNSQTAFNSMKVAADQGDIEAQFDVGLWYMRGEGTAPNPAEGFRYTKMAADQGLAKAQLGVASYYGAGLGIARNREEAFRYRKMAADQGSAKAQYSLALDYEGGRGTAMNLQEAFRYMEMAANQRDPTAEQQLEKMRRKYNITS